MIELDVIKTWYAEKDTTTTRFYTRCSVPGCIGCVITSGGRSDVVPVPCFPDSLSHRCGWCSGDDSGVLSGKCVKLASCWGGALAVFVVVYFYNPASLIVPLEVEPNPTAMFPIVLACETPEQVDIDIYRFPFSDMQKKAKHEAITNLTAELPDQKCSQTESRIYRMKDRKQVLSDQGATATSGGNLGVIVLPQNVVDELGDGENSSGFY